MIMDELVKKFPSLNILKKFPESGQKEVYLVQLDSYGMAILKIVKEMNERIRREIDIVNQNNLPGVPKIKEISSIEFDGNEYFYLFEEYIEGETLTNRLRKGAIPLTDSLKLFESLLIVVEKLESLNIVHRDIKPDNIICSDDGSFHLIDFGIARNLNLPSLTYTAAVVGPHTPGYGAPELFQYDKASINSKADLFSVGVVVYQAIFGKHPFITGKEMDINEIWYQTVTVTPENYLIPGDRDSQLMGLIQTLMQKQVSKRPPSAKKALEWFYTVQKTLTL
ncbi:serine/threonine protein kinase [Flintibacter muris]|uniref:serine/threonine protein kinase n=1 Tax=Flintibacter muris TaxID=2941327 RepID=UPI002040733D|nr:serine/threonine-protein kinase [Flintibacter muris]